MAQDRFDHVFVEPASFDASLDFYRGAIRARGHALGHALVRGP
jgi:hypothetical protein